MNDFLPLRTRIRSLRYTIGCKENSHGKEEEIAKNVDVAFTFTEDLLPSLTADKWLEASENGWHFQMDLEVDVKARMTIWGVGPKILFPTFAYLVVAGIATYLWPAVCLVRAVPYVFFLAPGVVLLAIGLPMLVIAVVSVKAAFKRDELATTGIFGVVRNPIYAAWIVFNIPGLVLLLRSWPMFFAPFLAYGLFKMLVRKEEKYLEERFGQAYLDYRSRVNEIIPVPGFRQGWRGR